MMMTMDGSGCEIADADNAVDDMICFARPCKCEFLGRASY